MKNEAINSKVNLCDTCQYCFLECSALFDDLEFGDGFGEDNVIKCKEYEREHEYE